MLFSHGALRVQFKINQGKTGQQLATISPVFFRVILILKLSHRMLTMNLTTEHNSDYDKNFGDARKQLMQTINQFRDGEISGEELMARVANANAVTDKIMREIKAQKRLLLAGKNS